MFYSTGDIAKVKLEVKEALQVIRSAHVNDVQFGQEFIHTSFRLKVIKQRSNKKSTKLLMSTLVKNPFTQL